MEGRKRWSSFDDNREMGSYSGRDHFKFPRTASSASESYNQPYNESYNQPYNESYNQPYNESYNESYNQPYNQAYNEQPNQPYNEQFNEPPKKKYGEPHAVNNNEHYSAHFSAPFPSGPSRSDSDVSSQRFPKEAGVQRAPWNQNKTEGICCCPAHEGNMCSTLAAVLPGLLGGAAGQASMMMKPFLRFPVNNNTVAPPAPTLFPPFNMMDPVQKAVMKHTFGRRGGRGAAAAVKRKQPAKCAVCQLKFNSSSQAQAHYRGSRHAKKLKMQQSKNEHKKLAVPVGSSGTGAAPSVAASANRNTGTKHKNLLDTPGGSGSIKAFPQAGVKLAPAAAPASKGSGLPSKTFQCQTCNIHVNSEIQLKQHISSKRHTDRVEGKPSKPKFNKSQPMEVTTSSDLSSLPQGSSASSVSSSLPCPALGPVKASPGSALIPPY
ncbi:zinc finger protein 385B isoform X2 [Vanacampus margaritifer]